MTTWTERSTTGFAHEERVCDELIRRGWTVAPWGQGVLPEAIRRALKTTESLMCWEPDLVAAQGSTVCLIDAKASMRGDDAWTYTVSRKAVRAHLRLWSTVELPIYYVFQNLGVATPYEVMQFCRVASLGEAGGYLSFPAGLPRPFDDAFGAPSSSSGIPMVA